MSKMKMLQMTKKEYEISIKDEPPDDSYLTIDDINTVREINSAQMNVDQETEVGRDRPTKRNKKYAMIQPCQQSTIVNLLKPHAHLMMIQMGLRKVIKKFGKKGHDTLLKQLSQLHE